MPYFFATWAVESWLPPTSEVISTSGIRFNASRCFCPNAPCPATQIFIGDLFSEPSCPAIARSKNGVVSLAYVPGIHVLAAERQKTWMGGGRPRQAVVGQLANAAGF